MAKRSGLISHDFLPGLFFLAFFRHLNSLPLGGDELFIENHKKILFRCQEEKSDLDQSDWNPLALFRNGNYFVHDFFNSINTSLTRSVR